MFFPPEIPYSPERCCGIPGRRLKECLDKWMGDEYVWCKMVRPACTEIRKGIVLDYPFSKLVLWDKLSAQGKEMLRVDKYDFRQVSRYAAEEARWVDRKEWRAVEELKRGLTLLHV